MFNVKFDDSEFRRLMRNLEALETRRSVSFAELFPPAFVARYTKFATMEALVDASGYRVESAEDFAAIPDAEWDAFIAANTQFGNWEDMQRVAGEQWAAAQLKRR